jgi:hypothetical protein
MLHTVCYKSQLSEVSFLYNFFSGKAINIENETQSTDIKTIKTEMKTEILEIVSRGELCVKNKLTCRIIAFPKGIIYM